MYVIARYSHSAHVIRNQLFLVGGVNVNHSVPGVACVDMNSKKVTEFQIPVSILKNVGNKMKEGGGVANPKKNSVPIFNDYIILCPHPPT